jgi:hypothetical protein
LAGTRRRHPNTLTPSIPLPPTFGEEFTASGVDDVVVDDDDDDDWGRGTRWAHSCSRRRVWMTSLSTMTTTT